MSRKSIQASYVGLMFFGLFLSACDVFRTKPLGLMMTRNEGPPEYRKGWEDGCKTGIAMMGNSYEKSFYKFTQDPNMITDKVYYQAWKNAFSYCNNYTLRWSHDPLDATTNIDPIQ